MANFREWRRRYPASVKFEIRRISGSGDVWVVEASVSYDGGPGKLALSIDEYRGDKLIRERSYVA